MKPFQFYFFFLLLSSVILNADPLRISVSAETQDFYLTPKNSSALFGKYEFKTFGRFDFQKDFSLRTNAAVNYVQMTSQDNKRILLNPTDFGLLYSSTNLDLNLGYWTVVPEATDLNNIFDVIHGKDYRQPFASENLGSLGLVTTFHFLNLDFRMFYIPKNTKSILPDTQSPWWPRTDALPLSNSSGTFLLPDNISYIYKSDTELNHPFDNNFGGTGKLNFKYVDFYGFYFSGANQVPQVAPHFNIDIISLNPLIGVVRPPVELDLTWYKSEHLGFGFSTIIDPVILKSFCKKQRDFLLEVAESEACTFNLESTLNVFKYSVRYFLQANRVWKKKSSASELETLLGFFEKSNSLGFLLDVNPENSLSGAFVYNEKSPSTLVSVRYEHRWSARLKNYFYINVITAQDEPLAKAYDQADNAGLKLTYDF